MESENSTNEEIVNEVYVLNDWANSVDRYTVTDDYQNAIKEFIWATEDEAIKPRSTMLSKYEGPISIKVFEDAVSDLKSQDELHEKALEEIMDNVVISLEWDILEEEQEKNIVEITREFFEIRENIEYTNYISDYCIEIIDKIAKSIDADNDEWINSEVIEKYSQELLQKLNCEFKDDFVNSFCKIWSYFRNLLELEYEDWEKRLEKEKERLEKEKSAAEFEENKKAFMQKYKAKNLKKAIKNSTFAIESVPTWGKDGVLIGNSTCITCFPDDQFCDGFKCRIGKITKKNQEVKNYMKYEGTIWIVEKGGIYIFNDDTSSLELKYPLSSGVYNVYQYPGILALENWKVFKE